MPYGFFSTVRRITIDSSACVLKEGKAPFGWTPHALQHYTGLQFSPTERKLLNDEKAMAPFIIELKYKIGHLLQLEDELIYIKIKEPGVRCVGLIIRHAILLDRQKGTPVIDMSVCFLSGETSLQAANAVDHLNSTPGRMRSIDMWKEEYSLFQNICNYFRASLSPSLRIEHPSLKVKIPSKDVRSHFRRVLMRPLFFSSTTHEGMIDKNLRSLNGMNM
jgi:hypothetical protein